MAHRYFVELAYKGTDFHGWQTQPNATSVQETLENAFTLIMHSSISLTGCGRTDAGVHAKYFVAHFDTDKRIPDSDKLIYKLNCFLPTDVVVFSIQEVNKTLHARFSALEREYEYHVITTKDPFLKPFTHRLVVNPDFETMNRAAQLLFSHSDFTSFSKLHTDVKTNNCKIIRAEWVQMNEDYWVFYIRADRFLRNMVRAIVGTLLEVGRHRISESEFDEIITAKNRGRAGTSMPGEALYLTDVTYPVHEFRRLSH